MVVEDVWAEGTAGAKALGQEGAGCGCALGPGGWIVGGPGQFLPVFLGTG